MIINCVGGLNALQSQGISRFFRDAGVFRDAGGEVMWRQPRGRRADLADLARQHSWHQFIGCEACFVILLQNRTDEPTDDISSHAHGERQGILKIY